MRTRVTTFVALLGLTGAFAACRAERHEPADSVGGRPSAEQSASDTARPTASTPSAWTVTARGAGPIVVGMSVDELRQAAGEVAVPGGAASECSYVHPPGAPAGLSVMLAAGRVARVDVDSAGVRTEAGIAVGDTATRVTEAYGARAVATPHKYVPGGQYLTVTSAEPADSTLRLVFEVEDGRVARFRAGRMPEVAQVERCG